MAQLAEPTDLETLTHAAARAGVSRSSLDRAARRGEVPYVEVGGRRFFVVDDTEAYGQNVRRNRDVRD